MDNNEQIKGWPVIVYVENMNDVLIKQYPNASFIFDKKVLKIKVNRWEKIKRFIRKYLCCCICHYSPY